MFDSENLSLGNSFKTESDLNSQERHAKRIEGKAFKNKKRGIRDIDNSDKDFDIHSS